MIDITDKTHEPSIKEISEFIENPLFMQMYGHLIVQYQARCDMTYSGDNVLLGWNVKFHRSGRALCRLYPKRGFFTVLLVVGRKEKERAEALLPKMSPAMQDIYRNTKEGMGQRWLLIDLCAPDALYEDVLKLVEIRRASK